MQLSCWEFLDLSQPGQVLLVHHTILQWLTDLSAILSMRQNSTVSVQKYECQSDHAFLIERMDWTRQELE